MAQIQTRPRQAGQPIAIELADDPLAESTFSAIGIPARGTEAARFTTNQNRPRAADEPLRGPGYRPAHRQPPQRPQGRARPRCRCPVSRFVALPHTEGCGVSSGQSEEIFARAQKEDADRPPAEPLGRPGAATRTWLRDARDGLRQARTGARHLQRRGQHLSRFGWASIQLDGGIEAVVAKTAPGSPRQSPPPSQTGEERVGRRGCAWRWQRRGL